MIGARDVYAKTEDEMTKAEYEQRESTTALYDLVAVRASIEHRLASEHPVTPEHAAAIAYAALDEWIHIRRVILGIEQ